MSLGLILAASRGSGQIIERTRWGLPPTIGGESWFEAAGNGEVRHLDDSFGDSWSRQPVSPSARQPVSGSRNHIDCATDGPAASGVCSSFDSMVRWPREAGPVEVGFVDAGG